MPVVRVSWFEGKDTPTKQAVAVEITGHCPQHRNLCEIHLRHI